MSFSIDVEPSGHITIEMERNPCSDLWDRLTVAPRPPLAIDHEGWTYHMMVHAVEVDADGTFRFCGPLLSIPTRADQPTWIDDDG